MILGSVSFFSDQPPDSKIQIIRSYVDLESFFHPVRGKTFSGGFYLNPRLPNTPEDFYFFDEADDIIVLLSGYVYNRSELISRIESMNDLRDPALIAKMFVNEGPEFVRKLNGDFAMVILRPEKRECYLYRDHIGIRPLAWSYTDNTLYFSNDIMGLCRSFADEDKFDTEYLLGYLKYIDYRKTPNKHVNKLLPGHYLKYSSGGIDIIKYWNPEEIKTDKHLQYDHMIRDLDLLLRDSVSIRCDNRFQAGCHASGGVDSGIVAALARTQYIDQDKFYGFSWSPLFSIYGEADNDERKLVLELCSALKIEPLFSDVNSYDFNRILSSFYTNNGFFSEDSVSDQIAKTRTNLVFSGWGGDEFLSTGDRGIELDLIKGFNHWLLLKRNNFRKPFKLIRYLLHFVIFPLTGLLDRSTIKSFQDDARYLKKSFKKSDKKAISNFYFHSSRRQLHLKMLQFYHIQYRCEHWYVMGFRKGIEYRYPLLDRRIIEYMLKVPSRLLCKTTEFRPLMRELGKGIVPEKVRVNVDKSEPVYWQWMEDNYKQSGIKLMDETGVWAKNPDMKFVDFDILDEDIHSFRNDVLKIDTKILFRALIYFKAIHEFTKEYRSS